MGQALSLQDAVFTLLFRLVAASSIAALIVRWPIFQRVLREEERELDERLLFVLLYGPPVALGVMTRILLGYQATDVSLEGALVAGLVGGRTAGMIVGTLVALPAFFNHELLAQQPAQDSGEFNQQTARRLGVDPGQGANRIQGIE